MSKEKHIPDSCTARDVCWENRSEVSVATVFNVGEKNIFSVEKAAKLNPGHLQRNHLGKHASHMKLVNCQGDLLCLKLPFPPR